MYDINNNISSKKLSFSVNFNMMPIREFENIFYEYDKDDNIVKMSFDDVNIKYNYDFLGRLINKKINDNLNVNYEYTTNGNRTTLQIKKISYGNNEYSYDYDKMGNIKNIYLNNKLINKYKYDDYQELIEESNYITKTSTKYEYDISGNLLSKKIYEINTMNLLDNNIYEYTNSCKNQLTVFNNENIEYDQIGNPIIIGDNELEWINVNELKSYNNLSNKITYFYDEKGLRNKKVKKDLETNFEKEVDYYYANEQLLLEKRENYVLSYVYDYSGDVIGFKHYSDENRIDVYYYEKNLQNDVIGILNSSFDRVARYNYDSWGNVLSIVNNQGEEINNKNNIAYINPYRYRSYYYDEETQLYYLNNRYYNPKWGRFLSPDAMIGSNTSIIGNNLYAYAGNDPINNIDDTGRNFLKKALNVVKNVGKAILNVGKTIVNAIGFTNNVSASIEEIDSETKGVIISGSTGRRANVSISSNKQDKPITIYSETNKGNLLDTALGVKTEIGNANIDTKLSASDTSITFGSYSNNEKNNTSLSLGLSATDFVLYVEYNHNVSASETISTDNYARIEINLMLPILIYGLLNGVKNLPVYNTSQLPSFGY